MYVCLVQMSENILCVILFLLHAFYLYRIILYFSYYNINATIKNVII